MRRPHLAAAALHAAATAYLCWGLIRHATSKVSFFVGDGFALLWDYWWAYRCARTLESPFRTNLLTYPHDASLVFHPLDLFDGVLTIPFQHLVPGTPGLVLGLNVIAVTCFFLSAFVAYRALFWLGGSWLPAVVGGFAYSFSAFHLLRVENPILGAMYWLPLYTMLYLRAARGGSWTRWMVAGLCLGLCTLQSLYYALFLVFLTPVLFAVALLESDDGRHAWRRLLGLTVVVGVFALPVVVQAGLDLSRTAYLAEGAKDVTEKVVRDDARNSIDVAGLVIPGPQQGLWRRWAEPWNDYLRRPTAEQQFAGENGAGGSLAYVGIVPLLLFVAGALQGPRRVVLPWAVGALVFLGLAMGPNLHLYGEIHSDPWLPLPYRLLLLAPTTLTKMFRAPSYFVAPALWAIWVVAAFGLRALLRASGSRRPLLVLGLVLWLVADYARPPLSVWHLEIPSAYAKIAADPRPVAVLQVPLLDFFALEQASFLQTVHQKPLVRGFVGRRDTWTAERDQMLLQAQHSRRGLVALLDHLGPGYIVVLKSVLETPQDFALAESLASVRRIVRLLDDELVTVYSLRLPRGAGW